MLHPPTRSTLFPYTTLFRSNTDQPLAQMSKNRQGELDALTSDRFAGAVKARNVVLTDRKSTRLNSSHTVISYAVFCLKKKRAVVRLKPRPSTLVGAKKSKSR